MNVEIRFFAQHLTEDEAFRLERERIAFLRSSGVQLANQAPGGEGAGKGARFPNRKKWSPERIAARAEKIRGLPAYNKGVSPSFAQRERASAANRGKPRPPELVEKTAAALRGRKRPDVGAKISAAKAAKKAEREQRREQFPGLHEIVKSWLREDAAERQMRWYRSHRDQAVMAMRERRSRRRKLRYDPSEKDDHRNSHENPTGYAWDAENQEGNQCQQNDRHNITIC